MAQEQNNRQAFSAGTFLSKYALTQEQPGEALFARETRGWSRQIRETVTFHSAA